MAHFAQLDQNNTVVFVTAVDNSDLLDENGVEQEELGIQHIYNTIPDSNQHTWKQTSYNNSFRKRYATLGSTYDEVNDVFILPKPYDSWSLNSNTYEWEAPVPYPGNHLNPEGDGIIYYFWEEDKLSWRDAVIFKPYPSWTFNENTVEWEAPVPYPNDGKLYNWDEESQSWK